MSVIAELLINTQSRTARYQKDEVLAVLRAAGVEVVHVYEVTRKQPLEDAVKSVLLRGPTLLVVGGGDGTISSVIDKLTGSKIEIGLIPLGTTNNFARTLNIPLDIEGAVTCLVQRKARKVDLGMINGKSFTNVAGIGLSAHIATNVTAAQKKRWGRFAYGLVGLGQMFKRPPFIVTIHDPDHELTFSLETRQVIVANGRFHAGKMIAEDARHNNKQLIIVALGGRSLFSFVRHMIDFYTGKRKKIVHTSYLTGRNVEILTNTPQPIELDGEVKLHTPVHVSLEPAAIRIRH